MTIQPSVLIWTIICFCLLMLILNKLLFRPLLSFMDARQARIDRAREKQTADKAAYEEDLRRLEQEKKDQRQRLAEAASASVEEARTQAEARIAAARQKSEQEISAFQDSLEAESDLMKTKLDAGVETLASTFANRLVS